MYYVIRRRSSVFLWKSQPENVERDFDSWLINEFLDHSSVRLKFANSYYEKRLDLIYAFFSRLSMHFNRLALKEKNAMEDQGIQRFNQVKITFSFEIMHTR